jgi:hypothetical protein
LQPGVIPRAQVATPGREPGAAEWRWGRHLPDRGRAATSRRRAADATSALERDAAEHRRRRRWLWAITCGITAKRPIEMGVVTAMCELLLPCNSRKPGDDRRFAAGCPLIALRPRMLSTAPVPRCTQYPRERRRWLAQPLGPGDWLDPSLPTRSRSKLPQAPPRGTPRRFASYCILLWQVPVWKSGSKDKI